MIYENSINDSNPAGYLGNDTDSEYSGYGGDEINDYDFGLEVKQ